MCKGYTCNNPVCLNSLALQQPKVDLTREITAGRIESQETVKTIWAFKNDPSTCYIYADKDIPVCMCILCVGVQCNLPQRLQTDLPCYMYYSI